MNGFSIYSELLNYEPIKWEINELKKKRPPMEAEIGSDLFKFIRNLLSHFPLFKSWDEVWCSELLVNWERKGFINKFLKNYSGKPEVKYRLWDGKKKKYTYLSINFPIKYEGDNKIYLKEIISEKEGIPFALVLMWNVLKTQIIIERNHNKEVD